MKPAATSFVARLRRAACVALGMLACVVPVLAQSQHGLPSAPVAAAEGAADAHYRLRVVGGAAGLSQYVQHEAPFWSRRLASLSAGRFHAEIVPYDRAGVPSMQMLRLMELGVVPMGTLLMSALGAQHPQYMAPDLPGLNPDIATLRNHVAAFRPYLEKELLEHHGIRVLAIYAYPAQVLFCKQPMVRLSDIKGRRIRVGSLDMGYFVKALGGDPVYKSFAQLVDSLEDNATECAITGTMAGHTLGLSRVTSYLYPMPLSWALSVFAAHEGSWVRLPQDLRTLLEREIPVLEQTIWEDAQKGTAEGIACNRGNRECSKPGKKGSMAVMRVTPQDERLRQHVLETVVLRQWRERCHVDCHALWQQTIAPVLGQRLGTR
jgi:TRAP-type C4-dicarboxylate transport system substrate-binding protein